MADDIETPDGLERGPLPYFIHDVPGPDGYSDVIRSGKVEDKPEVWAALMATLKPGQDLVKGTRGLGSRAPQPGWAQYHPEDKALKSIDRVVKPDQTAKLRELQTACDATITEGFFSTALCPPKTDIGQAYFYPSKLTDQVNLQHGSPVMCRDPKGVWALRDHDDAQLAEVQEACKSLIVTARSQYAVLLAQVSLIKTEADMNALNWSRPAKNDSSNGQSLDQQTKPGTPDGI